MLRRFLDTAAEWSSALPRSRFGLSSATSKFTYGESDMRSREEQQTLRRKNGNQI